MELSNTMTSLVIRILQSLGREKAIPDHGSDDSDHEKEWEKQQLKKAELWKTQNTSVALESIEQSLQSKDLVSSLLINHHYNHRQLPNQSTTVVKFTECVREEATTVMLFVMNEAHQHNANTIKANGNFCWVRLHARTRLQREKAIRISADHGSDDSDHEKEWEKQQLKKAGAARLDAESSQDSGDGGNNIGQSSDLASGLASNLWGTTESLIPSSAASLPRPANYQAQGIIKRLQDSRTSLSEVYRRHTQESDNIIDDLVACKTTIAKCNAEQHPLVNIFQFYQEIRGYVTDLRDCLNEKVPEISKLEDQIYVLYRQRAQKLVQRRRQDVKDQNNEFSPFAGKGAQGDEYRIRRAAEREGRRTRRRREREKKGSTTHHDGMSTDDEEAQSEINLMHSELENIALGASRVFEDVEDDFSQLKGMMGRFEEWRGTDLPTYCDAYVSYNLPKVYAHYIRLQLLLWNPLEREKDSIEVERMKWFNLLILYGVTDSTDDCDPKKLKDDPDCKLMSHLVEKVILVKLKDLVVCWWDPLSHIQTVRLVNLLRHYTQAYPSLTPECKPLRELTHAIIAKIRDAIENDIFIPMFPKNVYENKNSGVSLFFQRQFWVAWKLLSSCLMWHKLLDDSVIHDLAVRSLLNLYLLPALNLAAEINPTDSLDKCRNVINALPRAWVKTGLSSCDGTHAFLGRLEDFLVKLAGKLDPSKNIKDMKEIVDLLKSIGASKQAETISYKYL
ncbi:unnamed protein product, partial [Meganyctiphanes norvegica]